MTFTYDLCQMLIDNGLVEHLQEKLDVFFAVGRLTEEQYVSLNKSVAEKTGKDEDIKEVKEEDREQKPVENDKEA